MFEEFCAHVARLYFPYNAQYISGCFSSRDAWQKFLETQLCPAIGKIALRTLIFDIHRKKEEGVLQGESPAEQYDWYSKIWLGEEAHVRQLLEEFPEMDRLISLEIMHFYTMAEEITGRLLQDHAQIVRIFCGGKDFSKTEDIRFMGDPHKGGRKAARVRLDNGTVLYYKLHSLRRNEQYQKIYGHLCRLAKIPCKEVRYLTRESYGWEENVEKKGCGTKTEVENYYLRMGIHLWLGYALSASDLHGENIIAHGEYPVIVDMETFPGYSRTLDESSADRKIETMLADSAVHTGILPVLTWGQGSQAIVMSAVNGQGKMTAPFKLPVVKKAGTSEMYIDYEPGIVDIKESMVTLDGVPVNAGEYVEWLLLGFRTAYQAMLTDADAGKMLEDFFQGSSRVLLRHTQQYTMYQMVSWHPDYMGDVRKRRQLLSVMHREGETGLQRQLVDYEISSLMQDDVPYFEMKGTERHLYDGDGGCYENYFSCTPYEAWKKHRSRMGSGDMERQSEFIRLSMALLKHDSGQGESPEIRGAQPTKGNGQTQARIMKQVRRIFSWLCDTAVTAGEDIGWIGLQFWDRDRWSLAPAGIYLYGGIAGIVLGLAEYLHHFEDARAEHILGLAEAKLMRYTDKLWGGAGNEGPHSTGLLEGEASLIYVYLRLYHLTGEERYLCYAQRQLLGMKSFLASDSNYDLLSGNAGAVIAVLMLYQETNDQKYLDLSIELGEGLWKQRQETFCGVGWKTLETQEPLAGMSHGNSGFLMAYADLYQYTKDRAYLEKIRAILEYEDSLYSEEKGNWIDLRRPGKGKHTMNAWCHGAPGILLSRMKMEEFAWNGKARRNAAASDGNTDGYRWARDIPGDIVDRDLGRAARALFRIPEDGRICLCHGMAGNLLIMEKYLQKHDSVPYRERFEKTLEQLLDSLEGRPRPGASEALNPAFMNGITGVGFALLSILGCAPKSFPPSARPTL